MSERTHIQQTWDSKQQIARLLARDLGARMKVTIEKNGNGVPILIVRMKGAK